MAPGAFERLQDGDNKRGTADSSTLPSIMAPGGQYAPTNVPAGQVDYFAIQPASSGLTPGSTQSDVMSPSSPFTPSPSAFPLPPANASSNTTSTSLTAKAGSSIPPPIHLGTFNTGRGSDSRNSQQPLLQSPAPVYSPMSSSTSETFGADARARTPQGSSPSGGGFDFGLEMPARPTSQSKQPGPSETSKAGSLGPEAHSAAAGDEIHPPPPPYTRSKTSTTFTGFRPYSIQSDGSYFEEDDDNNAAERGQANDDAAAKLGPVAMARRKKKKRICLCLAILLLLVIVALVVGFAVGVMDIFTGGGELGDD